MVFKENGSTILIGNVGEDLLRCCSGLQVVEHLFEGCFSTADGTVSRSIVETDFPVREPHPAVAKHDIFIKAVSLVLRCGCEKGRIASPQHLVGIFGVKKEEAERIHIVLPYCVIQHEPSLIGQERFWTGPDLLRLPWQTAWLGDQFVPSPVQEIVREGKPN